MSRAVVFSHIIIGWYCLKMFSSLFDAAVRVFHHKMAKRHFATRLCTCGLLCLLQLGIRHRGEILSRWRMPTWREAERLRGVTSIWHTSSRQNSSAMTYAKLKMRCPGLRSWCDVLVEIYLDPDVICYVGIVLTMCSSWVDCQGGVPMSWEKAIAVLCLRTSRRKVQAMWRWDLCIFVFVRTVYCENKWQNVFKYHVHNTENLFLL